MNEAIFLLEIILTFSLVVVAEKLFKEKGLLVWSSIATIIANIQVSKLVLLFGIETTLGNVMFGSVFLANDILAEKYGEKVAEKSVYISLFSSLIYLAITQITVMFEPSKYDLTHSAMVTIFAFAPRICVSSMIMFFVSNFASVKIFSKLKEKMKSKKLWVRNNLTTILCNCTENFLFSLMAFYGVYPNAVLLKVAITTSVVEIAVAICDTPFLYLATKKV